MPKREKRAAAPGKPAPDKPAPVKRLPAPDKVGEQVATLNGNLAAVARAFGVSRSSVWEFVQKHPELQSVVKDAREGMIDHAESALYRAIVAGEAWAVCFFLKTQGKSRGYVEKMQVENARTLEVVEEIVDGDPA